MSSPNIPPAPPLAGSQQQEPPPPPPFADLSPTTCQSVAQFRAYLSRHRVLDDTVTTFLNRTLARFRDAGLATSPSLLSEPVSSRPNPSASRASTYAASSSASDLGTSTYAQLPPAACQQAFLELCDAWTRRQDALHYCMQVVRQQQWEKERAEIAAQQAAAAAAEAQGRRDLRGKAWDERPVRGETKEEMLHRQMANELSIEDIIRNRSLEVFKSRCNAFTPTFPSGTEGERLRALWEARPPGQ